MNILNSAGDYGEQLFNYTVKFAERACLEDPLSPESRLILRQLHRQQRLWDEHVAVIEEKVLRHIDTLRLLSSDNKQFRQALLEIVKSSLKIEEHTTFANLEGQINWQGWKIPLLITSGVCMTGVLLAFSAASYLTRPNPDRAPTPPEIATQPSPSPLSIDSTPEPLEVSPSEAPKSEDRTSQWRDRLAQAGISYQFFQNLLNDRSALAVSTPAETDSDQQIDEAAQNLYDRLVKLTPNTRSKLGTYSRNDYSQWLTELGEQGTASQTLDPITDDRFFQLFPELKGKILNPHTFGQIWFAIAEEQLAVAKAQQPRTPPYFDRPSNRRSRYRPGRQVPMSAIEVAKMPSEPLLYPAPHYDTASSR
jgi:hypothetical protein